MLHADPLLAAHDPLTADGGRARLNDGARHGSHDPARDAPTDRSDDTPGRRDPTARPTAVRVRAPGRLHLGFLDPSGTLGRRFGSLGLVIDGFETRLLLSHADAAEANDGAGLVGDDAAAAAELPRAAAHLAALQRHTGRHTPLRLHLQQVLPAHAGFGSGTQLALAVGRAFAELHELTMSTPDIARVLGRGLRSGIGIAGFDQGGLLLDGGPGADGSPAPLLARIEPPAGWRVLLVVHPGASGLSGSDEKRAIAALPPFSQASAAAVCHEVLMRVLPGAAGGDFAAFSAGVAQVQRLVGQHFAPAQEGRLFASAAVQRVCDWLALHQGLGTGQTSWGPTGFALLPSPEAAERACAALEAAGVVEAPLQLRVVAPRSFGASVESVTPPASSQA